MFIKTILINNEDPAVRVERYKMLANACQITALGIFAAAIIAPSFNPAMTPGLLARLTGGIVAGVIEVLALRIIGYIAVNPTAKGRGDDV